MNNEKNKDLNQKIDNELKKKELQKKYGADFRGEGNISPELENQWLNYIDEFEKQFNSTTEQISVWEYIGQPAYQKINELNPNEISKELERVLAVMRENNIYLDTFCEVDDNELYRFITEELFVYEIDNMNIPGMSTNFIYEEFHPNAKFDIEMAFDNFFTSTMQKHTSIDGKGYDLTYVDTKNHKNAINEPVDEKTVIEKINNFLNTFDYFEIISNEILEITINQNKTDAQIDFRIHINGRFHKSKETITYKGNGFFKLKPSEYGGWDIYHINMPGLKF
ncbi:MAG TPA: hypothetical protein VJ937_09605 [Salinivirga sp.]|uniref:hypothetical protein n=1 Tax=Salinivirga sp. TaxID=1970192 RepID=UPI002B47B4EC|nr:hypothetical protein [Salinivirga sp.]HKK59723.1 hypothetical protein [Salinivirga sp.]